MIYKHLSSEVLVCMQPHSWDDFGGTWIEKTPTLVSVCCVGDFVMVAHNPRLGGWSLLGEPNTHPHKGIYMLFTDQRLHLRLEDTFSCVLLIARSPSGSIYGLSNKSMAKYVFLYVCFFGRPVGLVRLRFICAQHAEIYSRIMPWRRKSFALIGFIGIRLLCYLVAVETEIQYNREPCGFGARHCYVCNLFLKVWLFFYNWNSVVFCAFIR